MIELEKGERVMLEKSANLRGAHRKVPGTLTITNRKLHFIPFLSHRSVTVCMEDIAGVEFVNGLIKKMKVTTEDREYVFSIREAAHVVSLVKVLIGSPQDL
ncbi:MAG TPA: hypothetical protein ENG06_00215 [Thermoplasmatales archaeon]|nr:hypothetical protein [Thermoplasmatales archaeon]